MGGVAIASFLSVPKNILYGLFSAGSGIFVYGIGKEIGFAKRILSVWIFAGLVLLSIGIGIYRFQDNVSHKNESGIHVYISPGKKSIVGTIIDEPEVREKNTRFLLRAEIIESEEIKNSTNVTGNILIFANRYGDYTYGDSIRITGELQQPESFDDFDYPAYLARNDIYTLMYYPDIERTGESAKKGIEENIKRYLFLAKKELEHNIERMLPEPHAAFMKGLLLGSRASMPEWLLDGFRSVGVIHIIALSGFNITIISSALTRFIRLFFIRSSVTFWVSLVCIAFFTIMVGASASIVRAALMGVIVLLARMEGRRYKAPNALIFTGALMIFHNPAILRFDIAFQLSFMATVGLMYVSPTLEAYANRVPSLYGMRDILLSTFAAQITVLPLIMYYFGTVSLISPIANILILIAVPLTMALGFLGALTGFISTIASMAVGSISYIFLEYQIRVVKVLSAVPFADIHMGTIPFAIVIVLYGILWCGIYKPWIKVISKR